jgi:hypothetical protein
MNDALQHDDRTPRLSRRHLLAAGGAGVAALWLAPIDGIAEAATLRPELKRATWLGLADPDVTVRAAGPSTALRLVEVADLPVATALPALQGHDGAFALRFTGPVGLPQGTHALRHAELGAFELFLVPVGGEGADRRYEAIVDRTVRVAGVNEEGTPVRVAVPDARGGAPRADAPPTPAITAAGAPVTRAAPPRPRRRPRVRRLAARRAASHRSATLDMAVTDLGTTRTLNALLLARGRVVGRGAVAVRPGRPLRVPVAATRGRLSAGRHELVLTLVDAQGRITRIRRRVRLV